jgi:hypothetical protein
MPQFCELLIFSSSESYVILNNSDIVASFLRSKKIAQGCQSISRKRFLITDLQYALIT